MESNIAEVQQGTAEWHESRIGRFTSSEIWRLMTDVTRPMTEMELADPGRSKNKTTITDLSLLSEGAITYVYEKIAEELTGLPAKPDMRSDATDWGNEWEGEARKMYERVFRVKIEQVGNVIIGKRTSGSPDGLIQTDGGIEIKCPYIMSNHVENLLISNAIALKETHPKWYWQIQDLLYITNRKWWDWLSFHPYFEGAKKMHVVRVYRNVPDIENIIIKRGAADQMTDDLLEFINRQ